MDGYAPPHHFSMHNNPSSPFYQQSSKRKEALFTRQKKLSFFLYVEELLWMAKRKRLKYSKNFSY